MQEHEPVKGAWQAMEVHLVVLDLKSKGIASGSLMQAKQPETCSDQGRVREPVLEIEELSSLASREGLILSFPPEALHDVWLAEARCECGKSRCLVGCETQLTRQVRVKELCHANTGNVIKTVT
jgi:hypothetical protein